MRKYLLFLSAAFIGFQSQAQSLRDNRLERMLIERPVMSAQQNHTPVSPTGQQGNGSRALGSILNSQRIGNAGNLLTIITGECNMVDVDDATNSVVFVHRNDPTGAPGTNVAQYRFDVSKDRGATWTSDIGPITNDPTIDNVAKNGRFPQGVIYNPTGNTIADSAYLIYSGTWHNSPPNGSSGSWQGQMRGRGKLSGDTSTFNVNIDQINGGHVAIASGMCKGEPGVFWNVNQDYNGTFATGSNFITSGLIIQKGVWNTTTKNVDWTNQILPVTFEKQDANGAEQSVATSFNIAFDPTGQYGWASCLGDLTAGDDSVYQPIFWKSVDFGATWTGPVQVNLDSVQGVVSALNPLFIDGTTPASLNPTTGFDADLSVDVYGNPHLLVIIGSGNGWSIEPAGYGVWDITFDAGAIAGCNWKGIKLDDIFTFRGTFTNDNPAQTSDNRPLVSRSPDGHKLFFFWNETDFSFIQSQDNDIPNLFGKAIDVVAGKITDKYNFTEGDTLWGGETSTTEGGVFYGSIFPTVSPTCLVNGNVYNVPLVMTQIDYAHDPGPNHDLGSSANPAGFWYISNINFPAADFNQNLDQVPPSITLNGADTVIILVNTAYTEDGATAFDCTDGNITPVVQNSPDTAVIGVYDVLYIATDAAGNSDTVVRTVIVGNIPVADFNWSFPTLAYKAQFVDQSLNLPTAWVWNFGDATGSTVKNPLKTFTGNGTYNVCLTASNSFGSSSQVCKQVTITGVGIDEPEFSQFVNLFPNPSTGKVMISLEGNISPELTVTVYNVLGEAVIAPTKYKAGNTMIELNLSDVSSGLYLVKLQSDKGTAVKHLTINHK